MQQSHNGHEHNERAGGHAHHSQAGGYVIDTANLQLPTGEPVDFSFNVVNPEGNRVTSFAVSHERPMHFIVVSKDLASFQHLHPELNSSTATFTQRGLLLPKPGAYRIFADFVDSSTHQGHAMSALAQADLVAGRAEAPLEPLGEPATECNLPNEYTVHLKCGTLEAGHDAALEFSIERQGQRLADLEHYLGAMGHAVILSEGKLHFIHAHPMETDAEGSGLVTFHTRFPEPGAYKVFAQFQHDGDVLTAPFVVNVI